MSVAESLHETFLNMSLKLSAKQLSERIHSPLLVKAKPLERENQCCNILRLLYFYSSTTQSFMSCITHTCIFIYWQMLYISLVCCPSKSLGYYSRCTKLEKAKKI